jgi:nucleoside-diphosphate kinase
MVGMKMLLSEKDTAQRHYTEDLAKRRGEKVREMMIEMITSGPIVALVLEGIDVIEVIRQMIGATEPKSALPGTIRGDYAHISYRYADEKGMGIFNLIHASDSPESAESEIGVWFKSEELVHHTPDYTHFTLGEEK